MQLRETSGSVDLDLLLGTLQTAETQVRWLMAEALPPAAQYRVERQATLRAHAALRGITVERRVELPPGWSELVEVDDAIDALLERLVRHEANPDLVAPARAPLPEVPPLPAELAPPAQARPAAREEAPEAAAPPPAEPAVYTEQAVHAEQAAYTEQAAWSDDTWGSEYGAYESSWGEQGGEYTDSYAEPEGWVEPAEAPLRDDPTGEVLQELELEELEELRTGPASTPPPTAAPAAAPPVAAQVAAPPAPAVAFPADAPLWPTGRSPLTEPDIGFGGGDFAGLDEHQAPELDPYAGRGEDESVFSLGDIGFDEPPRRRDEDLLDEVIERTHAELTLDLPRDWEDDEQTEVTEVLSKTSRPAAAAVQINADGSAQVVGMQELDEPSLASAIELGDESSQADVRFAGIGGAFGVSRVGEDEDEDDDDEVESVSVEGVSAIVHAPVPDPGRVRDWITEADQISARNVRQAVLLYSDVIDAEPGNLRALVARGRLYLDRGDYTRAASDFLKAEARAPSAVDVQISLGDLFFARKEYGRATAYFDTAVQLDPSHATAWYRRGLTRYYRREFQPALEDLERAKRLDASLPSIDSFVDKARRRQL